MIPHSICLAGNTSPADSKNDLIAAAIDPPLLLLNQKRKINQRRNKLKK